MQFVNNRIIKQLMVAVAILAIGQQIFLLVTQMARRPTSRLSSNSALMVKVANNVSGPAIPDVDNLHARSLPKENFKSKQENSNTPVGLPIHDVSDLRNEMFANIRSFFFSPLPEYDKYRRHTAKFVLGINSAYRPDKSYLIDTLSSLITNMSASEQQQAIIIVSIVEHNNTYAEKTVKKLEELFKPYLKQGLIEVTTPSPKIYPDLNHLPSGFGDSDTRIKWRTKQCYDDANLMIYAMEKKVEYYIHTEDDCIAARKNYINHLNDYLETPTGKSRWVMLDLSSWGSVGKMFHSKELPYLSEYILLFASRKPIDWLFFDYIAGQVCWPGSQEECSRAMRKASLKIIPRLLKHVGAYSSLLELKGKQKKTY